MEATIEVQRVTDRSVRVRIKSPCEMITLLAQSLRVVDPWDAIKRFGDGAINKAALSCQFHVTCPVPMAILKAIEVEAGLALPRDIVIRFEDRSSD
jgi:hypothetical protein